MKAKFMESSETSVVKVGILSQPMGSPTQIFLGIVLLLAWLTTICSNEEQNLIGKKIDQGMKLITSNGKSWMISSSIS